MRSSNSHVAGPLGVTASAIVLLVATPAVASGTPLTIERSTSAFDACHEGSWPNHRTGTQQIYGAKSSWAICWNNTWDAQITGSVQDTAADGESARVYIRFRHWENEVEGWHWHGRVPRRGVGDQALRVPV
jgi:hypothetical protein